VKANEVYGELREAGLVSDELELPGAAAAAAFSAPPPTRALLVVGVVVGFFVSTGRGRCLRPDLGEGATSPRKSFAESSQDDDSPEVYGGWGDGPAPRNPLLPLRDGEELLLLLLLALLFASGGDSLLSASASTWWS